MQGRSRWARGSLILLLALGAGPAAWAWSGLDPHSQRIGCDEGAQRLEITASSHLDPTCVYAGFDIRTSGVTLDCRGARIRSAPGAGGIGISIEAPPETALSHVTVRSCHVEGFLNGMKVTRTGFRSFEPGLEYEHPTSDIVIERSSVSGSRGVGIFVDGYVSDVSILASRVTGAGSAGIYLETGSRRNRVERSRLRDNGFRENGPGGQLFRFAGADLWFWGVGREGIAVDGSYENTIRGNHFEGNSAGGIFLYKNCGEYPDSPRYFERRFPSDANRIEDNVFRGGRNGIWVGSRMGENTLPMDCTDDAYVSEPLRRVVRDFAADNVVRSNVFVDVTYGIRVEDDGNQVLDNRFYGPSPEHHAVIVGTPDRTLVLGEPVRGTVLRGNKSAISRNAFPYRWVYGHEETDASGNRALGERHLHSEAPADAGDRLPDGAAAEDAQTAAAEVGNRMVGQAVLAGVLPGAGGAVRQVSRQVPPQGQHQTEDVLRHGLGRIVGGVADGDSLGFAGGQVDVVQAGGAAGDHL